MYNGFNELIFNINRELEMSVHGSSTEYILWLYSVPTDEGPHRTKNFGFYCSRLINISKCSNPMRECSNPMRERSNTKIMDTIKFQCQLSYAMVPSILTWGYYILTWGCYTKTACVSMHLSTYLCLQGSLWCESAGTGQHWNIDWWFCVRPGVRKGGGSNAAREECSFPCRHLLPRHCWDGSRQGRTDIPLEMIETIVWREGFLLTQT